jgi:AcrR family transcriptional regulator
MPSAMMRDNRDAGRLTSGQRRRGKTHVPDTPRSAELPRREQILAAAEDLLNQAGTHRLDVENVCAAAGVTRSAFEVFFRDVDDLLVALFDRIVSERGEAVAEAYRGETVWVDAIRAALFELLAFLDTYPQIARFLIVTTLRGDAPMLASREQALRVVARAIEVDAPRTAADDPTSPFGADAVVAAAVSVLHGRLLEDPVPSLRELGGSLMGVIVMPFLDASAARHELSRPLPPAQSKPPRSVQRRLPGGSLPPGMRVTNRTAQVLRAIAARPGMSNCAIASTVGILDQGQISRLLARLRRLELIEDYSDAAGSGSSKAWRLTPAGSNLLADLIAAQPPLQSSPELPPRGS